MVGGNVVGLPVWIAAGRTSVLPAGAGVRMDGVWSDKANIRAAAAAAFPKSGFMHVSLPSCMLTITSNTNTLQAKPHHN